MKNRLIMVIFLFCIFLSAPLVAKTLLFGDSLTAIYGSSFRELIDDKLKVEYMSGSGLINEGKKDWLNFVNNADLREYDHIIISLGTNDFVGYIPKTQEEYYIRLFKLISLIQKRNPLATVIWLSPPHLKNPEHERYLINTRNIIKKSADLMNVKYVDINQPDILGTRWQPVIDGQKVRTDDGIHITHAGSRRVISELAKIVKQED
ncbi:SGNH/GDSL hydrolase family protein [Morganella morganii]|nr:SGNH/GDSL hydrolase family protein [Morganella morganii]